MSSQEPTYKFYGIDEILNLPDPEWLIEDLIIKGSLAALFGAPGVGKSFIALAWAVAIAAGQDWHGRKVQSGPVVYIAAEGFGGLRPRVAVLLKEGDYGNQVLCTFVDQPIDFSNSESVETFVKRVQESVGQPFLVIIDTLARSFAGDENSAKDVGEFIAGADTLRRETGSAVLVVHHEGKVPGRGLRGSSVLLGAADTVIKVEAKGKRKSAKGEKSEDNEKSESQEKASGLGQVFLTCEKQKDSMPFDKFSLIGRLVELDGGGSSCVFDSFDEMVAGIMSAVRNSTIKKMLAILDEKFGPEGTTHSDWMKEACKNKEMSESTFNRRLKDAISDGLVEKEGDGQGARYWVAKSEPVSVSAGVKPVS
jgi:hypothetical protein